MFLASLPGRKVATVPDQRATPLPGFGFWLDDVIVFGSEVGSIRPQTLALCDERITIPQRGATASLNPAVVGRDLPVRVLPAVAGPLREPIW